MKGVVSDILEMKWQELFQIMLKENEGSCLIYSQTEMRGVVSDNVKRKWGVQF